MNDARSTVKTLLSFVLVIVLIVGALFGINLPYDAEDIVAPDEVTTIPQDNTNDEKQEDNNGVVEVPVEDDDNTVDEGVVNEIPQVSTPTEVQTENVDNSADGEVAEPTEDNKTATEGDVENA